MPTSNMKEAVTRKDQNGILLWRCSWCKHYVEIRHDICNWCRYDGVEKYIAIEDEID